jgi:hypothetical protein
VNPWILSGNDVYNTTGKVGIGTNTPAATLDVTGNVNVTGKINFTDASGNVALKISGFKNAGTFISLDNIKATTVVSGVYGGLSIGAVSTTFNALISGSYAMNGAYGGSGYNANQSITTTATGSLFGWGFPTAGDTSTYIITDNTNLRTYRIILQINYGFNNNFISIERLL